MVSRKDSFKFLDDDLTALEIINLLLIEISTYDLKSNVSYDIPVHNNYIKKEGLKAQENLGLINKWS